MTRTLYRRAKVVVTMDRARRVLYDADLLVEGKALAAVGPGLSALAHDRSVDLHGKVVIPGLVNTHHHLYQTLTRAVPRVQDVELFDWLTDLYEIWRQLTPEAVRIGALVGLGELLLSGCTTSTDHHYVFPKDVDGRLIDVQARAAAELGIRFHPTRGSMSRGKSGGGLPPDDLVQPEDAILADCERVIQTLHDPAPFSMCRVALAPCSPFSVTDKLLEKTALLARRHKVLMHTHLAETKDEEAFCLKTVGLRPLAYMERQGWVGRDVWYAHGIHFNDDELGLLAATKTGIAHCPTSNLRLASGIALVPKMRALGVPVGLAVDGSASNDSSNMLAEVRMALLVHRIQSGVGSTTASSVLEIATRGGAEVLNRDDIGSLEPGKAADFAVFDTHDLGFAGAMHDPVAALVFCAAARRADLVVVNGEVAVAGGRLVGADEDELIGLANDIAASMVSGAQAHTGRDFLQARAKEGPR
ncbi:MAG: 8-oxoguanine deaminase [Deltaproteobacteria bacterium]|nr:8-oxoguanine deaminase [Deltaproteobacteria bacterium]